MINDIVDNLYDDLCDFRALFISVDQMQNIIKREMARYAVSALMDSKIALEAQQVLVSDDDNSRTSS